MSEPMTPVLICARCRRKLKVSPIVGSTRTIRLRCTTCGVHPTVSRKAILARLRELHGLNNTIMIDPGGRIQ